MNVPSWFISVTAPIIPILWYFVSFDDNCLWITILSSWATALSVSCLFSFRDEDDDDDEDDEDGVSVNASKLRTENNFRTWLSSKLSK